MWDGIVREARKVEGNVNPLFVLAISNDKILCYSSIHGLRGAEDVHIVCSHDSPVYTIVIPSRTIPRADLCVADRRSRGIHGRQIRAEQRGKVPKVKRIFCNS